MATSQKMNSKNSCKRSLPHGLEQSYTVKVSLRFLFLVMASCITIAFLLGKVSRSVLMARSEASLQKLREAAPSQMIDNDNRSSIHLPNPVLKDGKIPPRTSYTSKNFDTAKAATINSRWVVTEEGKEQCVDLPSHECAANNNDSDSPVASPTSNDSKDSDAVESIDGHNGDDDDDEEHLPQGQHLLIDIENVDSVFLNSEERLAKAMLDLVGECGLTLLSYHCHSLQPIGVSCAGVLLESHVSFHTWPTEGVITLDLFTCGPNSLLPIVPLAERLFSVPSSVSGPDGTTAQQPHVVWAHKYRGFGAETTSDDVAELIDMFNFPLGMMTDYKEEIVSAETDFQRVDIYDVLRPHSQNMEAYDKSKLNDGSYEANNPELFEPDRIVFLDGVLQSRRSGDAPYHEALVHPALFTHNNPKRVAIIGGGEGATLREVLKHKTVEKVVMIEIDQKMVELSREYLPFWSDCSMLRGSAASCFDDARVEVYYEDAFKWFIDRYSDGSDGTAEPFDVIIMDALDPQVQKVFVDALYDGGPFLKSLPKAISAEGIMVAQVGEASKVGSPSEEFSLDKNRVKFIESLVELGFESIRDYEESHNGFGYPWQFIVAFKSFDTRADWYVDAALMNVKIRERSLVRVDGGSPFLYFDGTTMQSYLYPTKSSEVVFCRRDKNAPYCQEGHGFDPNRENIPLSALEVKPSSLGEKAGRGVFTTIDIPKNSYVGLDKLINIVYFPPSALDVMLSLTKHAYHDYNWGEVLEMYSYGYGHWFSHRGRIEVYVDPTIHCFINHGCDGSNNVGHDLQITEGTADPDSIAQEILDQDSSRDFIYNPAKERQVHLFSSAIPRTDIAKGEELFDNYLGMTGRSASGWKEDVVGLQQQCNGVGVGVITEWDQAGMNETEEAKIETESATENAENEPAKIESTDHQ